ncbi:GNAT family N-acetyltransferase [Streptomyces beigongshangae]|uniref:GNAT family N-acetyltransferase n=1 Tax=Streptomyces beigongshangae TaxID=2841597 RepID=UPI001C86082A|nr:GNAT family N-acetyltransferase [Streptomyces sp. REN17]
MTGRADPAVPCTVHTRLGADALEILARHWPALYAQDRVATPFQSPAWLSGHARLLPVRAVPLLLTATTAGGRIIAALALARLRSRARTQILPLSAPHATQVRLTGPHADNEAVARALALHLLLLHDTGADLALPGVRADTAFGRAVRTVVQDNLLTDASPPPVLALPFHADALAPSRRREHARRCRHWAQLAASRPVTYRRSHHQQALLDGLRVLAALQQTCPAGPGAADTIPWRRIVPDIGATGAFVADLHIDGAPVAAQLCLTRQHRCYSAAQITHPAYRHIAPAHALLRHLLDDLAHEGFHTFDPGRGTRPAATTAPGPPIRLAA